MIFLRSCLAAILLNLMSLKQRLWPALVVVVGVACVVGVLLSMLSMTVGLRHAWQRAGSPDRAIILPLNSQAEGDGSVSRSEAEVIEDAPGIARDAEGRAIADSEFLPGLDVRRRATGGHGFIELRTFGPMAPAVRPEFRIVAGRMYRPGTREVLVGRAAQGQFAGMEIGDKVILPDGQWPIVGMFSTGGDIVEGELIADRDTLMGAMRRNTFNSVLARLERAPDSMDRLKAALAGNSALSVIAERHSTYYEHMSGPEPALFSTVAYTTGGFLAIGAFFGALNLMYAAVSARTQEIGTLRALGFGALPVAVSVVSECLLLALTGTLIGSAIAWLMFNGAQEDFWATIFDLKVTPGLIGLGMLWALVIALLGSLAPAIRAARLPIVEALRAT